MYFLVPPDYIDKNNPCLQVGLARLGLSESDVLHEVTAITDKLSSQSELDMRDRREDMLHRLDERRMTVVTGLEAAANAERVAEQWDARERESSLQQSLDDKVSLICMFRLKS